MKNKYSAFSLVRNALTHNRNWREAWRSPEPKRRYDALIVGGGGHGLATAYYLAKEHRMRNVAVPEKGWIGGGNTGRNTTIIRSNYLWDESAHLYEHSLKLYERLSEELNYNIMLSQRGVLNLAHNQHDLRELSRRVNAIRLNGIDSEILTPEQIHTLVPILDVSPGARYPVLGASLQRRGGVARHDGGTSATRQQRDQQLEGHQRQIGGEHQHVLRRGGLQRTHQSAQRRAGPRPTTRPHPLARGANARPGPRPTCLPLWMRFLRMSGEAPVSTATPACSFS